LAIDVGRGLVLVAASIALRRGVEIRGILATGAGAKTGALKKKTAGKSR
jgi:hypothetical protein